MKLPAIVNKQIIAEAKKKFTEEEIRKKTGPVLTFLKQRKTEEVQKRSEQKKLWCLSLKEVANIGPTAALCKKGLLVGSVLTGTLGLYYLRSSRLIGIVNLAEGVALLVLAKVCSDVVPLSGDLKPTWARSATSENEDLERNVSEAFGKAGWVLRSYIKALGSVAPEETPPTLHALSTLTKPQNSKETARCFGLGTLALALGAAALTYHAYQKKGTLDGGNRGHPSLGLWLRQLSAQTDFYRL